jgi:hypothetical protein
MIAKVYQVDPLVCTRCGRRMSILAFVTDGFAIRRILDHLGLSAPEAEKPPPPREVLRVAEHDEGLGRAGGVGVTRTQCRPFPLERRGLSPVSPVAVGGRSRRRVALVSAPAATLEFHAAEPVTDRSAYR